MDEVDVARVSMITVSTVRLDLRRVSLKQSDRQPDLVKAHIGCRCRKPRGGAGGIVRRRQSGTRQQQRRRFRDNVEELGIGGGRGEEIDFLGGFGGERNALIFRDEGGDAAFLYSSMRFTRSSSEVIDTRAFRSSDDNWQ